MNKEGKWSFNEVDRELWGNPEFDTKEEAIEAGRKEAKTEGWKSFNVGRFELMVMDIEIDEEDILNGKAEQLDDEYGGDFEPGDYWYERITEESRELLRVKLSSAFEAWLDETGLTPDTCIVTNIKTIEVEVSDGV